MHATTRARLALLAGAALFSTGGAAIKFVSLSSWQVASGRAAVAALALAWLTPVARRDLDGRTLLTAATYAATMVLFVTANKLTTAANTIFLQSTAPLYILLLAPRLLGERLRRSDLPAMAAIAVGLTLFFVGTQPASGSAPDPLRGNLLAAASGLTWALTVMGLRAISRDPTRGAGATLVAGNVIACLACLPWALPLPGAGAADWLVVGALGVFQIGVAYTLVNAGLRHVAALEAVLLLLLEPLLNPLWAALLQGERPGVWSLAGGGLILAATVGKTVVDARPARRQRRRRYTTD